MYTRKIIAAVLLFLAAAALPAADSDLRTWTSAKGEHTLKAEYLGKKGKDKIYLLKENDRLVTVALDALSDDDRAYVAETENTDPDRSGSQKPSKAVYAKSRKRAEQLFREIDEWKDDEDFQDVGFDPAGPFFRWQLQAKKLRKTLEAEPGSSDSQTNLGALATAAGELIKLGEEYAENAGSVTKRTRQETEYIQGLLDSLTDDPQDAPQSLSADEPDSGSEPNPFEEEASAPPKVKSEKKAGPKSRKPKVDASEDEENSGDESGTSEESAPARRKDRKKPGGLVPLIGSLASSEDDEDSPAGETAKITYEDFEQIEMGMTKEEVFAVLGKGVKVSVPFVDAFIDTGLEVYLWENGDDLGGCEITFDGGKVSNKAWSGPVPKKQSGKKGGSVKIKASHESGEE